MLSALILATFALSHPAEALALVVVGVALVAYFDRAKTGAAK